LLADNPTRQAIEAPTQKLVGSLNLQKTISAKGQSPTRSTGNRKGIDGCNQGRVQGASQIIQDQEGEIGGYRRQTSALAGESIWAEITVIFTVHLSSRSSAS